jgi:serine/threonine protein kinase
MADAEVPTAQPPSGAPRELTGRRLRLTTTADGAWQVVEEADAGVDGLTSVWAGPATLPRGLEACTRIARLLAVVHARGITHGDLGGEKTVAQDGEATLLRGFSARASYADRPALDWLSGKRGVPGCIAPEVLRAGGAAMGPPADLFALGTLLYRVLGGGRHPFDGQKEAAAVGAEALERNLAVLHREVLPPDPPGRRLPAELGALCIALLDRRPEARPDAEHVAATLAELSGHLLAQASTLAAGPCAALAATLPAPAVAAAAPAAPADTAMPPSTRYHSLRELARGGFGRIYRAHDRQLDRTVALKAIVARDPLAVRRFEREVRLTARLDHPAIVPIYDSGVLADGRRFYAMKLISGRTLAAALDRCHSLEARLALLPHLITACDAIAHAHAQAIIHRDLKPQNVLVDDQGGTLIIDWGLAKDLSAPAGEGELSPLTAAGSVLGTPAYMAPEQAEGAQVDARADLYSLGAILYHLLSGRPPYPGARALADLVAGAPAALRTLVPLAPAALCALAEKAMSRRVADRHTGVRELAVALRAASAGLPAPRRMGVAPGARPASSRPAPSSRLAWLLGSAATAVVIIFAVLATTPARPRARNDARRSPAAQVQNVSAAPAASAAPTASAAPAASQPGDEAALLREVEALVEARPGQALALLRRLPAGSSRWRRARLLASRAALASGLIPAGSCQSRSPVTALGHSADGTLLAVGTQAGSVAIEPVRPGARTPSFAGLDPAAGLAGAPITDVSFSPDGTQLLAATAGGHIRLFHRTLPPRTLAAASGHPGARFFLDGQYVMAFGPRAPALIWQLAPLAPIKLQPVVSRPLIGAAVLETGYRAIATDGQVLFGSSIGGGVLGKTRLPRPPSQAIFASDGSMVLLVKPGKSQVLRFVALLSPPGGPTLPVALPVATPAPVPQVAAFSTDAMRLVSVGADRVVRLWDLEVGEGRALGTAPGDVRAIRFLPDGTSVVVGGSKAATPASGGGAAGFLCSFSDPLPRTREALLAWLARQGAGR